jgi:hypothetical protein
MQARQRRNSWSRRAGRPPMTPAKSRCRRSLLTDERIRRSGRPQLRDDVCLRRSVSFRDEVGRRRLGGHFFQACRRVLTEYLSSPRGHSHGDVLQLVEQVLRHGGGGGFVHPTLLSRGPQRYCRPVRVTGRSRPRPGLALGREPRRRRRQARAGAWPGTTAGPGDLRPPRRPRRVVRRHSGQVGGGGQRSPRVPVLRWGQGFPEPWDRRGPTGPGAAPGGRSLRAGARGDSPPLVRLPRR